MSFSLAAALEAAVLPEDAVEVGRVTDAWGVRGWFKVLPYSGDPQALFSSKRWYVLPAERGARNFEGALLLPVAQSRAHGDGVVAQALAIADRSAAEQLEGARVLVPRSSFPTPDAGEFYWVDLIGCAVVNRQGVALGVVRDLLATGPQTTLVLQDDSQDKPVERLIPFVDAFVDEVDIARKRMQVDWQPDY